MSSTKFKIIYSLQIHIALQSLGFAPVTEMKNPKNPKYNCWVYEESKELLEAFDALLTRKECGNGR
jgi:hypothetical protein